MAGRRGRCRRVRTKRSIVQYEKPTSSFHEYDLSSDTLEQQHNAACHLKEELRVTSRVSKCTVVGFQATDSVLAVELVCTHRIAPSSASRQIATRSATQNRRKDWAAERTATEPNLQLSLNIARHDARHDDLARAPPSMGLRTPAIIAEKDPTDPCLCAAASEFSGGSAWGW